MRIVNQEVVGYTRDPLWGFATVVRSVWDSGRTELSVHGSVPQPDDMAYAVSRTVEHCPPLALRQDEALALVQAWSVEAGDGL